MAKRTRRPTTPASRSAGPEQTPADVTTSRVRANRPARARRAEAPESALTRYRTLIFGGVVVLVVVVLGYVLFGQSSVPQGTYAAVGPQYACDTLLTPGPVESVTPTPVVTPSPSPSSPAPSLPDASAASASPDASASPVASSTPIPPPTPRLGFTTTVLGRGHVLNPNDTIEYGFCPPTSGNHYNVPGRGPIRGAVYPTTDQQPPGGWVHNLEHGWVVALYRCTGPNDCPSDAEMQQLQAFFDQAPTRPSRAATRKSWSRASTPWTRLLPWSPGDARC